MQDKFQFRLHVHREIERARLSLDVAPSQKGSCILTDFFRTALRRKSSPQVSPYLITPSLRLFVLIDQRNHHNTGDSFQSGHAPIESRISHALSGQSLVFELVCAFLLRVLSEVADT